MIAGRRRFLAGLGALAAARIVSPPRAAAMGRTPLGGRASFHVPWPTASLDPHDLRDPMAALFGPAVADPVFAVDATNVPYPALTAGMPTREAGETVVRLREGMRTARLAPLDGRDLVFSIERARSRGASALLADIPKPVPRKGEPLAVNFGAIDPMHLARALASPLCALLPRRFDPTAPDGTGAFLAKFESPGLVLTRNAVAARGPSFLDAIEVAPAPDLKTSLRDFEAERDDLGWLGMGLHDERKGAVRFDLGRVAWVVLVVSADSGPASIPGGAQRLVDAIPPERLAHLGLGPLPSAVGSPDWLGPPAELLVDDASPHLLEVARAVAPVLSNPGHEVTVTPVPRAEIPRRARGHAALAIELVRPLGHGPHHQLISLAAAEGPDRARDVAKAPYHGQSASPRALTELLRVGVIGDIRIAGGVVPDLVLAKSMLGDGWDLGASFRRGAKRVG